MAGATRVSRLRALIDHPRTGAAERAAAQRMLARLTPAPVPAGDRTYGARHDLPGRHASVSRIAEMIREDLTLARLRTPAGHQDDLAAPDPIRDAPAAISYTVDTLYDTGIVLTVHGVPAAWGSSDDYGTASPALNALITCLEALANAYNRDGSDIEKRYFTTVRVDRSAL
ncbi:hypothetical protein [Nocardia jejuensis]|uniref:hypothetical protein n=1 Tax=Nocardia jejuensis TaxID=328049 RepID=UPI000833A487|nr:hypothetical protein [Nocardia jejuensis]